MGFDSISIAITHCKTNAIKGKDAAIPKVCAPQLKNKRRRSAFRDYAGFTSSI
ncbi:hypothetical protein HMPREF0201_01112 [Cedecea davisae DSM 4568]|uniref:Uncharacterized protein n=1 Tax=Cedecea davisae DSM 4568 TaxID=566551 RepID=S3IXS1_9ENTR|nr:hypothetical protein HMPREF0201_01112 [Cedecea davisae DSM 4568]